MAEYVDDANLLPERTQREADLAVIKKVEPAVIRNLGDAGCDKKTIEKLIGLEMNGDRQGQLSLLEKHRRELLDSVHKKQKQIDCLDYLVYQMGKAKQDK